MLPLSCSRAARHGAKPHQATLACLAVLSMCLSGLALAAGDCDVCPRPPETAPISPVAAPADATACDVCPKSKDAADASAADPATAVFRDCSDCPGMVAVPAHDHAGATFRGFAMSATAVSVESWRACVAAGPCSPVEVAASAAGTDAATGIMPAEARVYAAWLSGKTGRHYRLPSDAEWTRAVAAGVAAPPSPGATTFRVARDVAP